MQSGCVSPRIDRVTIAFSKQMATIFKELPNDVQPLSKYMYYM